MAGRYRAKKKIVDGITFDSIKEANHYLELKELEEKGEISNLVLQEKFMLLPTQCEPSTFTKTGKEKRGRVIERALTYTADFSYYTKDGEYVVEDVKPSKKFLPKEYIIKRKLMLWFHNIRIKEVV